MNKILVNVYVPVLNTAYDMLLPSQSRMYEVQELIKRAVAELSDGRFAPDRDTVVCIRSTGAILDIDRQVWELGIGNGAKLMVI